MQRALAGVALICFVVPLAACGGRSSPTNPSGSASFTVSAVQPNPTVLQTTQLSATETSTGRNVTGQTTWQSSHSSLATVSSTGLLTALGVGTVTITGRYQGDSKTLSVAIRSPYTLSAWNGTATVTSCSGTCTGSQATGAVWPTYFKITQQSGSTVECVVRFFDSNQLYVTINGSSDNTSRFSGTGGSSLFTNTTLVLTPVGPGSVARLSGTFSTFLPGPSGATLGVALSMTPGYPNLFAF